MPDLRVAVVHYHLRPGGVTRVINHGIHALAGHNVAPAVLCGEPVEDPGALGVPIGHVEGMSYTDEFAIDPATLADRMLEAARAIWGQKPDVWHIHNHSLGKNPAVPCAVRVLAERGEAVILHIHDYAEDGRPANYRMLLDRVGGGDGAVLTRELYPIAPHVHYALLNPRDHEIMARAGVPGESLTLLPNAVDVGGYEPPEGGGSAADRLFLYPTRAIRRKNLGEFLLWAALAEPGERYAVTLAPDNPKEKPLYERWVALAESLKLPAEFELGARWERPFVELLASAHALVTTSVQEGFGLAFMEPWLVGRPLVGRDLPDITAQFEEDGIDLRECYRRLDVPLEWVGAGELRAALERTYAAFLADYDRQPSAADHQALWHAAVRGAGVDFARLNEPMQRGVIERAAADRDAARSALRPGGLATRMKPEAIADNRQAVMRAYNIEQYGRRLMTLYARAARSARGKVGTLAPGAVLDQFLRPERFIMLLH